MYWLVFFLLVVWWVFEGVAQAIAEEPRERSDSRAARMLTTKQKRLVLSRDGYRCVYCGTKQPGANGFHVDHIVPVARGGTDDHRNLITACCSCNLEKGSTMLSGHDTGHLHELATRRSDAAFRTEFRQAG